MYLSKKGYIIIELFFKLNRIRILDIIWVIWVIVGYDFLLEW